MTTLVHSHTWWGICRLRPRDCAISKSMQINASQKAPLTIDGQATEEVNCFTHLGSIVSILRLEAQLRMLSKLDLGTLQVIKYN